MGINSSMVLAILILLGFMALLLGLLWVLYKLIAIFSRWLSRRKFFIKFRQSYQARKKAAPTKRRMSFMEFLAEIFAEPVILTIAIVILYDHFKGIWDTSPDFATFWIRVNESTRGNMLVGIFFTIALIIWITVVASRHNREEQRDKAFEELQKTNTDKVVEAIEKLAEAIREDRKDKDGKPSIKM